MYFKFRPGNKDINKILSEKKKQRAPAFKKFGFSWILEITQSLRGFFFPVNLALPSGAKKTAHVLSSPKHDILLGQPHTLWRDG